MRDQGGERKEGVLDNDTRDLMSIMLQSITYHVGESRSSVYSHCATDRLSIDDHLGVLEEGMCGKVLHCSLGSVPLVEGAHPSICPDTWLSVPVQRMSQDLPCSDGEPSERPYLLSQYRMISEITLDN